MTSISWLLAGASSGGGGGGGGGTGDINIAVGDDLVSEIAAAPAGSSIYLGPGLFRVGANFVPKNSQTLIGTPGATIIDGSVQKTSASFVSDGSGRYYIGHTFQPRDSLMRDSNFSVAENSSLPGTGATGATSKGATAFNSAWDRDQAWWDGVRMTPVVTLAAGDAATGNRYYIDRANNRLYVWNNPVGHIVEIDSTPYAINNPAATGVEIRGITFRRFASPLQRGAVSINNVAGWEFNDCTFVGNHAIGLYGSQVQDLWTHDCTFDSNGQLGMGIGTNSSGTTWANQLIEDNVFTANNQEDFYIGDWEAGGFKTTSKSGGMVRNNTFTDNRGLDMWVDFGSQWVFDGNSSSRAWGQAIRIEVASYCIVRNNTIDSSGINTGAHYKAAHQYPASQNAPADTCAISISESSYVEVTGNTVADPSLNGIVVNVRGRTNASASGSDHVHVFGNTVTQRQTPIYVDSTNTSTVGTMIAGGVNLVGAPQALSYYTTANSWTMPAVGPYASSGVPATRLVDVHANHYRVGDLTTTRRFAYGKGVYQTANSYAASNPTDATDVTT